MVVPNFCLSLYQQKQKVMQTTYKIIDGSSKARIGKTIIFNRPVAQIMERDILKTFYINMEFEGEMYNAEMYSIEGNKKEALLYKQNSKRANSYIKIIIKNNG